MANRLKIVVNKNIPLIVEVFSSIGNVIPLDSKDIKNHSVKDADILIVRSETKVNENLLKKSNVRFVGTVTSGIDHVDIRYLKAKGIEFASAPGSNSNSVTEYIAASLLTLEEKMGYPLKGKTIGVVGIGNVGSKVVKLADIFGMNVLQNDPPLQRKTGDSRFISLDDLMEVDIITLHVPLTIGNRDATYHLFDRKRIMKMKKNSILINTSRGGVVENEALKNALVNKHIGFAILDVWENEPSIDVDLLNKVFLGTPHIAGYSIDGKINALRFIYRSVCKFIGKEEKYDFQKIKMMPNEPIINLLVDEKNINSTLISCINFCYNILEDDKNLRVIENIPAAKRGYYFQELRKKYRTRYEFHNYLVRLSKENSEIETKLSALGFDICKTNTY